MAESVYQNAMMVECRIRDIEIENEIVLPVYYKSENVVARRTDLLVKKKVIVELKAVTELNDTHLAQAINYLEAFNLEVSPLINFGSKSLQYKRVINPIILTEKSK